MVAVNTFFGNSKSY